MSGFMGNDMSLDRHAKKGKISKAVKEFVPDEFIRVP
jgi:hypothetical protein